jgi:hypothetical protein
MWGTWVYQWYVCHTCGQINSDHCPDRPSHDFMSDWSGAAVVNPGPGNCLPEPWLYRDVHIQMPEFEDQGHRLMWALDEIARLRSRLSTLQTEADKGRARINDLETNMADVHRELALEREAASEAQYELGSLLERLDHLFMETASDSVLDAEDV